MDTHAVQVRLVGGALSAQALADLALAAGDHADGHLYLTDRACIELRGIPANSRGDLVDAVKAAGLLTSDESVRTVVMSPLSGRLGGQADLRTVATRLGEALDLDSGLVEPGLVEPGRDLVLTLDDGRGDLVDRDLDLGIMAVDPDAAQIRVGPDHWGEVVELQAVPDVLLELARAEAPTLGTNHARDLRTQVTSLPAPHGVIAQDDGLDVEHVDVPDGRLTHDLATHVLARAARDVVITPWHSLLLVDLEDT